MTVVKDAEWIRVVNERREIGGQSHRDACGGYRDDNSPPATIYLARQILSGNLGKQFLNFLTE